MTVIGNPARLRMEAGGIALGIGVRLARTVEIAKAMRGCGYDWLFLDFEHGSIPLDAVMQISVAALDAGIAPIVRVPQGDVALATRALDNGAQGVIMPHVDTAEEARELARRLRYPPIGTRSIGGSGAQLGFKPSAIPKSLAALDAETLVIVMIETRRAVENVDAIAAVPGIDVLLVGTNDLCADLGVPGGYDDPRAEAAFHATVAACQRHGKRCGVSGAPDEATMRKRIAQGAKFVMVGSDFPILMSAAEKRAAALRGENK